MGFFIPPYSFDEGGAPTYFKLRGFVRFDGFAAGLLGAVVANVKRKFGAGDAGLLAGSEVFYREFVVGDFVLAADHNVTGSGTFGCLKRFLEAEAFVAEFDLYPWRQLAANAQGFGVRPDPSGAT